MKKTTKLVGAVLGVLLVAALFVGAGAAADGVLPTTGDLKCGTSTLFDINENGTLTYQLTTDTESDITIVIPAQFSSYNITGKKSGDCTFSKDVAGTVTLVVPKTTTATAKTIVLNVTATKVGKNVGISAQARIGNGATKAVDSNNTTIYPILTLRGGAQTVIAQQPVTVDVVGTAGDEITITPSDTTAFGAAQKGTIGPDGTTSFTFTAKAVTTTPVKFKGVENGVDDAVTDDGAKVVEAKVTIDDKGKKALYPDATKTVDALSLGDSFKLTFNGGLDTNHYYFKFDKDTYTTTPASTGGQIEVTDGMEVTFTVKGISKLAEIKTVKHAIKFPKAVYYSDDASVATSKIEVVGVDGEDKEICIIPTLTLDKSVAVVGEDKITATVKGAAPNTAMWLDTADYKPKILTLEPKAGQSVDGQGVVKFTTDANGEATIVFNSNDATDLMEKVPFIIGIGTADYGHDFDLIKFCDVVPTMTFNKTIGGETGWITIKAAPGMELFVPDTEYLFFPTQEGVVKRYDNNGDYAYAHYYNVFTTNEYGYKTLKVEYALSDKEYHTVLPLYKIIATPPGAELIYTGHVTVTSEVTDETIPVMAYHPYEKIDDTFIAGKYYFVNDQGVQTATYINALPYGGSDDHFYFAADEDVHEEGIYVNDKGAAIRLYYPNIDIASANVVYTGVMDNKDFTYGLWDAALVKDDPNYKVEIVALTPGEDFAKAQPFVKFEAIDANGAATVLPYDSYKDGKFTFTHEAFKGLKSGEYVIQAFFDDKDNDFFVPGTPEEFSWGEFVPFNIIKAGDENITLSTNEVVVGEKFVATVTGLPGHRYEIVVPSQIKVANQKGINPAYPGQPAWFTMGASGAIDVTLEALGTIDDANITLQTYIGDEYCDDATITVNDALITAKTDKEAYTIGEDIKVEGTSSGAPVYFYIEGTNVPFTQIKSAKTHDFLTANSEEWDVTINYEKDLKTETFNGVSLDAGTYTLYVSTETGKTVKEDVTDKACVTLPLVLKQSFITLTSVPEVVAQGGKITVEGTANAAKSVIWYLFGTNFFEAGVQKVKDDEFTITIDGKYTKDTAAGQYFLVVQHPMYDGKYSIAPQGMLGWNSGDHSMMDNKEKLNNIALSEKDGIYTASLPLSNYNPGTVIFDADIRQTNNAAQALCDALDSQNFDDMYAKASFIVGAPSSIVNPIPTKVTQGEKITISGTTTGHVGDIVAIDFISTAFAAVPKEVAGTAAFVTITTKVQDDGTWSVVFDTSNLNCDDYNVSVAVGSLGAVTSKITITEKQVTPTVKPTVVPTGQPTVVPTTAAPTQTPSTPGFGILAALAGLGAVAVLLLRRQ